jgi:drug/metabolite transporter superfamily protein YnfA
VVVEGQAMNGSDWFAVVVALLLFAVIAFAPRT